LYAWQVARAEFIEEMRLLSRLRHPCITTVMGAVIDSKNEPLLIMERMEHGSLHDLAHNNTVVFDGEMV
jgi:serine/threonine protein kinase